MQKICPLCGISSKNSDFVDSLCSNCYKKRLSVKCPSSISIKKCKKCGKIRTRDWSQLDKADIQQEILKQCIGSFDDMAIEKTTDGSYLLTFLFKKGNKSITISKSISINFEETMCTNCSRMVSGYYEAILQLRGDMAKINTMLPKLIHEIKRRNFLAKVEELKEGTDLYIGSKVTANELVSKHNFKVIRSNKLHGLKDGRRVYRLILCVHL